LSKKEVIKSYKKEVTPETRMPQALGRGAIRHRRINERRKKMKKLIAIVMSVVLVALLVPGVALAGKDVTGNGTPSGGHFNLNIIGVKYDKDVTKEGGSVIFVPLDTTGRNDSRTGIDNKVDISLVPNDLGMFYVIDGNATDDNEAVFTMPRDVATTYEVYICGRGKPIDADGADIRLAGYDEDTDTWYWAANTIYIRGHKTKIGDGDWVNQKMVDVTTDLLVLGNGDPVFDPDYEDWLWLYGNKGQKIVKLRFYPVTE
jgi:hypothetical protein